MLMEHMPTTSMIVTFIDGMTCFLAATTCASCQYPFHNVCESNNAWHGTDGDGSDLRYMMVSQLILRLSPPASPLCKMNMTGY